jgi:hypothetical protein
MLPMSISSLEQALRKDLPHHWVETEAEVSDCTFTPFKAYIDGTGPEDQLAHYTVGFTYKVNGTVYEGVLSSPVEVEPHDTFAIRYNPYRPEQNNSLESELDRPWFKDYTYLFAALLVGLLLLELFHRHTLNR